MKPDRFYPLEDATREAAQILSELLEGKLDLESLDLDVDTGFEALH